MSQQRATNRLDGVLTRARGGSSSAAGRGPPREARARRARRHYREDAVGSSARGVTAQAGRRDRVGPSTRRTAVMSRAADICIPIESAAVPPRFRLEHVHPLPRVTAPAGDVQSQQPSRAPARYVRAARRASARRPLLPGRNRAELICSALRAAAASVSEESVERTWPEPFNGRRRGTVGGGSLIARQLFWTDQVCKATLTHRQIA